MSPDHLQRGGVARVDPVSVLGWQQTEGGAKHWSTCVENDVMWLHLPVYGPSTILIEEQRVWCLSQLCKCNTWPGWRHIIITNSISQKFPQTLTTSAPHSISHNTLLQTPPREQSHDSYPLSQDREFTTSQHLLAPFLKILLLCKESSFIYLFIFQFKICCSPNCFWITICLITRLRYSAHMLPDIIAVYFFTLILDLLFWLVCSLALWTLIH